MGTLRRCRFEHNHPAPAAVRAAHSARIASSVTTTSMLNTADFSVAVGSYQSGGNASSASLEGGDWISLQEFPAGELVVGERPQIILDALTADHFRSDQI